MYEKASIIIPTMDGRIQYLPYVIKSLSVQSVKPSELIIIVKNLDTNLIEKVTSGKGFRSIIIEQKKGYFTDALNMGRLEAKGDLSVFTDDDAIVPKNWLKNYCKLHEKYGQKVACISSRDLLLNWTKKIVVPSYDDSRINFFYRKLIRPWYERPLKSLSLYRNGAYITQDFCLAIGPMIPNQLCYSLPFRGVNMCFKREAIVDAKFPEHPLLKRGVGNEAYLGLQLHRAGFLMLYTPDNPVLHIIHESISRPNLVNKAEVKSEWEIMRKLYRKLLVPSANRLEF